MAGVELIFIKTKKKMTPFLAGGGESVFFRGLLKSTLAEEREEKQRKRGMSDRKVQANVLSRLKRHASDGEDKIGSPGSIVNAVARELRKNNLCICGDGSGRAKHYSNIGEEMKTVSKKRRSVSFCNIFLIYSTRAGK